MISWVKNLGTVHQRWISSSRWSGFSVRMTEDGWDHSSRAICLDLKPGSGLLSFSPSQICWSWTVKMASSKWLFHLHSGVWVTLTCLSFSVSFSIWASLGFTILWSLSSKFLTWCWLPSAWKSKRKEIKCACLIRDWHEDRQVSLVLYSTCQKWLQSPLRF